MELEPVLANIDWYFSVSLQKGILPRCPYANVDRCPRYYESLSLLGSAGITTALQPSEEKRLLKKWKKSEHWPKVKEHESSIWNNESFHNFCPEVTYDVLGLFASELHRYVDEIDIDIAHKQLSKQGAPVADWRWQWSHITPLHYSECRLYSQLLSTNAVGAEKIETSPHIEVSPRIEQKPTIEITSKVAPKKHKWWKIIAGIIVLLGGIWSLIQIYESKTFQSILHNSKGKNQIPAGKELLDDYGRTPLYARTKKRIDDIYEKIENEKLNPWIFINIDKMRQVTMHDGKVISYKGVMFEGTPRLVFWSDDFIPPFIEDAIIKVFDQTIEECRKNNLDPEPYISEAKSLLYGFINKVYSRMAYIDQKLSSKGGSSKVGLKDVSFQIDKMNECLKKHYDAAVLLVSKDRNLKNAD